MSILFEERPSDSPFVDTIMCGRTLSAGLTIRPAENGWHMVFVRYLGEQHPLLTGPLTAAGPVSWNAGGEILWVRFKLGVFMPHLPPVEFVDREQPLPGASGRAFWLGGTAWEYPDFENVETFLARLAGASVLAIDPVVAAALEDRPPEMSPRTLRHRIRRATGLSHGHIRQFRRARRAADLLHSGVPIPDAVFEAGYYDQPHLTRDLKRFIGLPPRRWIEAPPAESVRVDPGTL